MRLLAIRDLNQEDPLGPLGKKIEPVKQAPASAPAPKPSPFNPDVFIRPDGTLETRIKENEKAKFGVLEVRGTPRRVKVGDRVRILKAGGPDTNREYVGLIVRVAHVVVGTDTQFDFIVTDKRYCLHLPGADRTGWTCEFAD